MMASLHMATARCFLRGCKSLAVGGVQLCTCKAQGAVELIT